MSQASDKLLEMLGAIGTELHDGIVSGKALVVEQSPILVQEIVHWGIVDNMVYAAIWLLASAALGRFAYKLIKKEYDLAPIGAIGMVIAFFCLMAGVHDTMTAIKCVVSPRLYIIENAADIIKGMT